MSDAASPLPPYAPGKPCWKCGGLAGQIKTVYFEPDDVGVYGTPVHRREPGLECLQRTCRNCTYTWLEAPLNAAPTTPPPASQAAIFVAPDTEELQ
jgi:hypothetical protein